VVLGGIVTDAARLVRGGRGLAADQAPLLSRVELPTPLSSGVRRNARNLFDDSREIRFGDEFNATLRADSPISYNHNGEYINGTIVSINEETGTATVRSSTGPFAGNPGVDVDISLTGINAPVPDLLTSGGPLEIDHLVDVPGLFLNRTVPLRLREIDGETAIVTSSDGGVFRVPLSDIRGASPMDEARFLRESRFEDTTVVRGDVTRLPQYNTLEGITETSTHRAVTQALIDATPERYTEVVNSVFASRRDNTIVLGDFHIGGRHNPADSERNLENSISFLRSNRERFSEGQVIIAGDVTDSSIYTPLLTGCPNNNYSLCSDEVRNQIREQVFARQGDILARISRESGLPPERFTFQLGNHELPRQTGDRISGPQTTGRGEILYDQRARADLLSYLRSREDLGGLNILEDVDGSSQRTLPNGLNTEVSHYAIPPSSVNLPGSPALGPRAGSPIDGDVDIIIGADNHTLDIRFDGDATARGYISNPNIGGRGASYDSQVLDEAGNPIQRDSGLFTVILGDGRPAVFGPCGSPQNTSSCLYNGNEFRAQTFSSP
ncbi:MAG: hypothetical protein NXH75_07305, partial [Halobacteriovoraceae bacterium]|nr:hypothetical protein [Halobacteriovoraceae bacterium]